MDHLDPCPASRGAAARPLIARHLSRPPAQSEFYWSATTLGADPAKAWGADFGGIVEGGARFSDKTTPHLV